MQPQLSPLGVGSLTLLILPFFGVSLCHDRLVIFVSEPPVGEEYNIKFKFCLISFYIYWPKVCIKTFFFVQHQERWMKKSGWLHSSKITCTAWAREEIEPWERQSFTLMIPRFREANWGCVLWQNLCVRTKKGKRVISAMLGFEKYPPEIIRSIWWFLNLNNKKRGLCHHIIFQFTFEISPSREKNQYHLY